MPGKVFYVTKGKLEELKKEHKDLVAFERHKTVGEEAPKILESEDINPEFISFQEDMDALRNRINHLENVFENHHIIKKPAKEKQHFVDLGARVTIEASGKNNEFTIVGTLEANPDLGKISNESPVGKALLGHKIGDEILISFPEKKKYKIKSIKYEISQQTCCVIRFYCKLHILAANLLQFFSLAKAKLQNSIKFTAQNLKFSLRPLLRNRSNIQSAPMLGRGFFVLI